MEATEERVVARFIDGKVLKGYAKKFSVESDTVDISEAETGKEHQISIADLKALFFIKSFSGDSTHREKKAFGISENKGQKVYIKFSDRESLMGFIEGNIPWGKGFFLSDDANKAKGFFLQPVDGDSNNIKVFVVGTSIEDLTIMVK